MIDKGGLSLVLVQVRDQGKDPCSALTCRRLPLHGARANLELTQEAMPGILSPLSSVQHRQ